MSLLRKFLSLDNLSKYEKEQKKRYKQYVKLGISNTVILSKPESEIYQDYLVRQKSLRHSKRKLFASRKESKTNDIFREPSASGTLSAAPAVLDAVNKNIVVNNMPEKYINDLQQMEGFNIEMSPTTGNTATNTPTQSDETIPADVKHENKHAIIETQGIRKKSTQHEHDVKNTQPLEQKFSFGNQEHFLDQLDEVIKSRNRSQSIPSMNVALQDHVYENTPNPQKNKIVPVAKPRKKAAKKISEDRSSIKTEDVKQQEDNETDDNQRNSFVAQNSFVPIEVQEKLNAMQQAPMHNQEISLNQNQAASEDKKELSTGISEDKIDGIQDPNRKERNDSGNYQVEYEELKWSTSFRDNMPEVTRSESCITTQSEDSFFDCVSDNDDIYDDEERNVMEQISPHYNDKKFLDNDVSESDSKSIDSVRVLDHRQQISLQTNEKELSHFNSPEVNPKLIIEEQASIYLQDDALETEFRSINSEDITAQDIINKSQQASTVTLKDDQKDERNQDLPTEFESLNDEASEDDIEPDSLEMPKSVQESAKVKEIRNDYVQASQAEIKQVKESDFTSKMDSQEKLHEYEEAQTQNEALFLDDNYKPTQFISNLRDDPEVLKIPYNQKSNKTHLIKLENNNDYDDFEVNQEKHEGKKVTFDFGKSYCQTYEVDSSQEESELIDSNLISALTKDEGQVFMPVDNELYKRMQQKDRNKLRLNTNDQDSEDPRDERNEVFQSYGVQLTPEEEMIENIFESSKNMDVAFLNCVDGFDLNIQEQKGESNPKDIENQIYERPYTESNQNFEDNQTNSPTTNVENESVKKPFVPPRNLKGHVPLIISKIEEHVETANHDKKIILDVANSNENAKSNFDDSEARIEQDQQQESLRLIDFAEDNQNNKRINEKDQLENGGKLLEGPQSLLLVDNGQLKEYDRRSSILDEPTSTTNINLGPINVTSIREGSKLEDHITNEHIQSRPTSSDLFNEFHVSLENFEENQEEIVPRIDSNSFLNEEGNNNKDKIVVQDYSNDFSQEDQVIGTLISLEYIKENADSTPINGKGNVPVESNKNEEVSQNIEDNNTKLLTILESPWEKHYTIRNEQHSVNEPLATDEKTVPQLPLRRQHKAKNDEDVFYGDISPSNTNNNAETIQDSQTNAKNIFTKTTNEDTNDLESVIIRNTPTNPRVKSLQLPFGRGYISGRKSVDFSENISPPPTQTKFHRSMSHTVFPAHHLRPKPIQFDRFKTTFTQNENGVVSSTNDTASIKTEDANGTTKNSGETVAEIQERLTRVSKMHDAAEQLLVMQDILESLKKKSDSLNSRADVEYLPLLQSLFKSVRVVSSFQCDFDEKLLASQQNTLKDVKKCISELSLK